MPVAYRQRTTAWFPPVRVECSQCCIQSLLVKHSWHQFRFHNKHWFVSLSVEWLNINHVTTLEIKPLEYAGKHLKF